MSKQMPSVIKYVFDVTRQVEDQTQNGTLQRRRRRSGFQTIHFLMWKCMAPVVVTTALQLSPVNRTNGTESDTWPSTARYMLPPPKPAEL